MKTGKDWGGKVSKSPESVRSPESGVRSSEGRAKQESRVTSYKSQSLWTPDSGLRTPESVYPKHSKIFENMTCFVSFVSFGSFRSPESLSGGAFFQGRSEGHFPEGSAFSGGAHLGIIWRAFSGVRRAFPEWPCFGGSEGPTFRNAIFRSWTPESFIIGATFRSPEASLSASTTGKLITDLA